MATEAIGLVGVSKAYPGVNALTDVSFSVTRGRVHGFLGPNGAGKSTTMNIVTGLLKQTSGSVRLNGEELEAGKRKNLIGYLPELPPLYPQMLVGDYLRFVAGLHGLKGKRAESAIDFSAAACGLTQVLERMIGNLSKGYRQRVGIAQALVFGAEIIILDEPTVGLDPVSVSEIRNLIQSLKGERTVLLSSHLLHEVSLVCDDITMINHGKIVASGSLREIQEQFISGARYRVRLNQLAEETQKHITSDLGISIKQIEREWLFTANERQENQAQVLLEKLVLSGCGVSAFYEEKTELEDIFKAAMQSEAVS